MNREVKTYKFTCDKCGCVEFVRDVPSWKRPEGWAMIQDSGYGMTNYTKNLDYCAECYREHECRERNKVFW